MEKITAQQVKNKTRAENTEKLYSALISAYGEENVFKVGDSEFSVYVGNAPTGEEMYVNFGITVKEYEGRRTEKREYKAYNGKEQAEIYEKEQAEKAEKQAEKDKLKAEKQARDKAAREKQKEAREKARREKAEKKAKKGEG